MTENNEIIVSGNAISAISDDSIIAISEKAEKRIEAVRKMKQMSLKVTNPSDWIDQQGKPYLQASGSEKVARLFGISWQIDEPTKEIEEGGHFNYTSKGYFSLSGATIECIGTRSSKDGFFKKYKYNKDGTKTELPLSAIDSTDVKKAALTNLIGNGITRLLGIRNLTYEDLNEAGIDVNKIGKVEYKSKGKGQTSKPASEKKQLTPEQTKLWAALVLHCGNDLEKVKATLKEKTSFPVSSGKDKGKIVPGKDSIYDVSDKQAQTVRHQIEKLQEKQKESSNSLDAPEKCQICAHMDKCELSPDPECKQYEPLESTEKEPF